MLYCHFTRAGRSRSNHMQNITAINTPFYLPLTFTLLDNRKKMQDAWLIIWFTFCVYWYYETRKCYICSTAPINKHLQRFMEIATYWTVLLSTYLFPMTVEIHIQCEWCGSIITSLESLKDNSEAFFPWQLSDNPTLSLYILY